jgi:beta-lactam-binding protein with PASTA domain
MINMRGMSFSRAKALVKASGMKVGRVMYQYRENTLPNTVISHKPAVGAPLKRGKPVDFLISQ